MDEVTDLSLKMLGKSIKSIPLFMKGIFYEMPFVIASVIQRDTNAGQLMTFNTVSKR